MNLRNLFESYRDRLAARRRLQEFAGAVQSGPFSIIFKRVPDPKRKGRRTWGRETKYPRLDAVALKDVERDLKAGYPGLNRRERRQLARGHRWMFLSQE